MSKRRQPGDVVWKRGGAGFSANGGYGLIPAGSEPVPWCPICNDPECQEWPDLWELGADGKPTGNNWYHVSECEMHDKEPT